MNTPQVRYLVDNPATMDIGGVEVSGTASATYTYIQHWVDTSGFGGQSRVPGIRALRSLSGQFAVAEKDAARIAARPLPFSAVLHPGTTELADALNVEIESSPSAGIYAFRLVRD